jgi:hypothetical protein
VCVCGCVGVRLCFGVGVYRCVGVYVCVCVLCATYADEDSDGSCFVSVTHESPTANASYENDFG